MEVSFMIKLICSNHGAMDYGDLVDIGSGLLDVKGVIDTVMGNYQFFVVTLNGNKRVVANTKVRLCKAWECTDCCNLHLCKFYLYGDCRSSLGRRGCRFCHDMDSEHNARVLRDNDLQDLDRTELCTLLLQNDSTLVPPACFSYNKGDGEYGNCPDQESCRRLHICDRYLRGTCRAGGECSRSHDFFEPHPLKTLQERGVPSELIGSMLFVYQNIQAMNNRDNSNSNKQQTHGGNANNSRTGREKTEICLYFVKGSCNQGDRCWREHSSLPYKWEVRNGNSWSALPDNEKIEYDFCVPANVYSQGAPPVYFDAMTCGSAQVRRLSTVSSVLQPTFVLTTEWAWYWQDEYDNWIQYSSLEGQHRLSSITSEDLERKYQEDSSGVLEFTVGSQAYKLFFQDMLQTNEQHGTVRLVRRRPVFVSTAGAQKARTSKSRPSHNFKAVPAYWDKSMLPDTGYKKITLQDSSDEYQKILSLFHQTMRGYRLASVERVQNRALWEVFQWQKDLMRKNNAGRNVNERLLFHGTDSTHVDAICKQNFDWRLCGTHGTAYGKGSYFARDAKYSQSYTGSSGMRTMFVCRVLVGGYTKGDSSYLRPPSKDGGASMLYDSCVDNVRDPSIFVVFEKHQVYPEYIIIDCRNLHLCKFYLYGDCRSSLGRRGCRFCHDMDSEHNARVLRDNDLQDLDRTELCTLLLQNDSTLVPPVCFSYNKGDGEYGNCPDQESCRRLHICERYLRERVPSELIGSMLFVYQNIQAMKNHDNSNSSRQQTHGGNANNSRTGREKTEICLYFVKGSCKQGDRCWREHSSLPYKWEVRNGNSWSALPDNEKIEKDFCIPANVYSQGAPPVHFDAMTCGSAEVRRLSTVSSVLQPTFVLTTEWAWYWRDEYDNWIQYSSLEGQHRLSSITSEDLERKYQENSSAVLEFTAGSQAYKLFFQDMLQTNEQHGTVRLVRRRPVFVSTAGAQKARTSKSRPSYNFQAVPAYWDKSMLPDTGYKKITLQDSSDEYQKILSLFHQTMRGYRLASVERVQNRALWEVFQWQKDLMRKNNAGRNVNERLLFHGTDSTHIDAICKQNFDWRLCGTHGTAYGKGSYFARDAKYSHSYTGSSGMRTMFVCRVLVGGYTKGDSSYLRPPSKDGGDSVFYDSCVDNVRDPSIFVVFEKHQVYPEYILIDPSGLIQPPVDRKCIETKTQAHQSISPASL
ncbi:hypothetical protein SKAU_G00044330 [Synaphobranchus kaupii]|uniref:Poly [ADP-ribose] polymerase 12 n=1 Tax=Synaphobranchus kaupii TaxID=118154 RepID=A0A9Q1G1Q2_SYNKA|nr:hypothetical protein SKAU_G00044330 [Synaphobranchus kaupii]